MALKQSLTKEERLKRNADTQRRFYQNNKPQVLEQVKKYQDTEKGKKVKKEANARRRTTDEHKLYHRAYCRNKYNNDTNYRLALNLRNRLSYAIRCRVSAVRDLGCSIEDLKRHLESKFQEGMTWENYGSWHIDHIKPLAAFNLQDSEDLRFACHYSNLQPLWAKDNLKKGNKHGA
jgi:hypothetical protein